MTPVLSILVATKNRIPYCKNLIETVLSFEDTDFELVVQDNSDTLELKDFADTITDKRFKYSYTPPPFSSIDNFNAVLEMASGTYLCLIGDDDSVNPDIFKVTRWANEMHIDSIVPVLKAVYLWPDTCRTLEAHKNKNGLLTISKITGSLISYSPLQQVRLLMRNGAQNYLSYKLPKLYHGIIRREKIEAVKAATGHYIGGLTPDIYSAIALSFFVNKVYYLDYPLTIPGICTQSTSGEAAVKKRFDKLEDGIHFRDRGAYDWSSLVPKFYSDENIWADTAIAALKDLKQEKMLAKFNVSRLTIILLKKYNNRKEIIFENYFRNTGANDVLRRKINTKFLTFEAISMKWDSLRFRIQDKIKRKVNTWKIRNLSTENKEIENLKNVSEATAALNNYLSSQNQNIEHIIENGTSKLILASKFQKAKSI